MFEKNELKLLWPFYLSSFFKGFGSLFGAYIILFFLDLGFSLFQISVIYAGYSLAVLFFDIPTGAIADVYGRKVSVFLSFLFTGILFLIAPLFNSFMWFLGVFVLWGVFTTLFTGSLDAWVVDHLKLKRKNDLSENYFINSSWIGNVGFVGGPLLAATIVKYLGMIYLWPAAGVIVLLAGVILLFASEKKKHHKTSHNVISQIKNSGKYIASHNKIKLLLVALVFFVFVLNIIGFLWQPYLKEFNVPLEYFGYSLSLGAVLSIFAPIISKKLKSHFDNLTTYFAVICSGMMILIALTFFLNSNLFAFLFVALSYTAISFLAPLEENFFQKFLPSKMRSTIGSVKSMLLEVSSAIAILIAGVLTEFMSVREVFFVVGFLLIPSIVIYLKISKN